MNYETRQNDTGLHGAEYRQARALRQADYEQHLLGAELAAEWDEQMFICLDAVARHFNTPNIALFLLDAELLEGELGTHNVILGG
jgi:hypothetical protein